MPKLLYSCWDCQHRDRVLSTGECVCFKASIELPTPVGPIPPDCPLEDAPDVEKLLAENKRLQKLLDRANLERFDSVTRT